MTCVSLDFHTLWEFDLRSILVESRSLFSQYCLLLSDTYAFLYKYSTCNLYTNIQCHLYYFIFSLLSPSFGRRIDNNVGVVSSHSARAGRNSFFLLLRKERLGVWRDLHT